MEQKLYSEKIQLPSFLHSEESTTKLLLSSADSQRKSRKSLDIGIPRDKEHDNHDNSRISSSLKDIRRLSASTVWDLEKPHISEGENIAVYKRRWFVLAIYVLYGIVGSIQWPMYSIIANVITKYYKVSNLSVDFTNLSFLITYVITCLPAAWLVDKIGIRRSVLLGCYAQAVGCLLRLFSVPPNRFWLTMIGQSIVGLSQVFQGIVSTRLAAVWFPANEVSFACSVAYNGVLIGSAVGYVMPPLLVRNSDNLDQIGDDLNVMYMGVAASSFILLGLALLFFAEKPPLPPSQAQRLQRGIDAGRDGSLQEFVNTLKRLLKKKSYMLLMLSFSTNVGVFVAAATLLNQIIIPHFPGKEAEIGLIGLIEIASGVTCSFICSYILDRTHAFKTTIQLLYILSLFGWIAFAVLIRVGNMTSILIAMAIFGFAEGLQPVALEFGVEVTFPEPEGTSSGLLCGVVTIFAILTTLLYGFLLDRWGDIVANAVMTIPLLVSILSLMVMRPRHKRQAAQQEKDPQPR